MHWNGVAVDANILVALNIAAAVQSSGLVNLNILKINN